LLDRIEVGAVWREIEQHCAAGFDSLADASNFMNSDIIHDDNVASLEGWSKDLLDISQKGWAIHRSIQQEGRSDAIVTQRCDKGRSLPMTMRHLADEPLTTRSSTVAAGHVCGCGSFIDEYEPSWIELGLHPEPCLARCGYVRAVLFGRVQAFF